MDFDWSEIGKVLSYLIPVIMFILFNVLFRKQREQQRRLAVVKNPPLQRLLFAGG